MDDNPASAAALLRTPVQVAEIADLQQKIAAVARQIADLRAENAFLEQDVKIAEAAAFAAKAECEAARIEAQEAAAIRERFEYLCHERGADHGQKLQ